MWKVVAFITLGVVAVFVWREIVETLLNIAELLDRKKSVADRTRRRESMVFNRKTGRLEDSDETIVPFD